jgi:hypothetical protein
MPGTPNQARAFLQSQGVKPEYFNGSAFSVEKVIDVVEDLLARLAAPAPLLGVVPATSAGIASSTEPPTDGYVAAVKWLDFASIADMQALNERLVKKMQAHGWSFKLPIPSAKRFGQIVDLLSKSIADVALASLNSKTNDYPEWYSTVIELMQMVQGALAAPAPQLLEGVPAQKDGPLDLVGIARRMGNEHFDLSDHDGSTEFAGYVKGFVDGWRGSADYYREYEDPGFQMSDHAIAHWFGKDAASAAPTTIGEGGGAEDEAEKTFIPGASYCMGVDIAGLLINGKKAYKGLVSDDNDNELSPRDTRAWLVDQLQKGRKVLPMGECENWDYQTGCQGHVPTPSEKESHV